MNVCSYIIFSYWICVTKKDILDFMKLKSHKRPHVPDEKRALEKPWLPPRFQTVDKVSHYCAGFFFAKYQNVQCLCGFFGTFLV